MKLHANARTCPKSRRLIVNRIEEEGWSLAAAAEAAGVSERTAAKWLARWRAEGDAGLRDRSSAPRRRPTQLPAPNLEAIEALRRLRMTAAEIAECLQIALSTVSRWLRRIGLGKLSRLEPPEPPNRYERSRPGELVHVDVKKLGRIQVPGHRVTGNRRVHARRVGARRLGTAGWEFVHVCVDDATRLAYAEVLADERGPTAAGFLRRAVAWFRSMGVGALAAGVSVFELARIMGTSGEMIERAYGTLIEGAGAGIASRLDAFDARGDAEDDRSSDVRATTGPQPQAGGS